MTAVVAGDTSASRSIASTPLIPGRRMSRIATSGRWASTRSTAASALGALATSSMSSASRKTTDSPSSRQGWSSTATHRIH